MLHIAINQRYQKNSSNQKQTAGEEHPAVVSEQISHTINNSRAETMHDAREQTDLNTAVTKRGAGHTQ